MRKSNDRGKQAEEQAAEFLNGKGHRILAQNYRVRGGELDIVSLDGDVLVFAEVKMRSDSRMGMGRDYVDRKKQMRLIAAAERYVADTNWTGPCRFDVVEIQGSVRPEIIHILDAFET